MKKNHYYNRTIQYLENNPGTGVIESHIDFSSYDDNAKVHIAQNLTTFRKNFGLSQASMCQLLDISTSQYKKYESGSEVIRTDIVQRLSLKCGLPMFDLLAHSKYAPLLNVDNEYSGLHQVCFYANSLTDDYFQKLCHLLLSFSNVKFDFEIENSGITSQDFELALKENEEYIYIAMAEGIRAVRHFHSYSQEQSADLINVSVGTYREYEKTSQRPRFNMLTAARAIVGTGVSPFAIVAGTHYANIRIMQNTRIHIIKTILSSIDHDVSNKLEPMMHGFIETVRSLPYSSFFSW